MHVWYRVILHDCKHYSVIIQRLTPSMRCTFQDVHYLRLDGYFHEYYCHDFLPECLLVGMAILYNVSFSFWVVNGGYSDWMPYGDCSQTCGGGVQIRERTCTDPPPSNGGEDCSGLGPNSTTRECNSQECPGNIDR